jgi:hypothetical protein
MVYIVSMFCLLTMAVLRGYELTPFGFAQIPSVFAMSVLMAFLTERTDFKDVYSGMSVLFLIFLPSSIVVYAPIVLGFVFNFVFGLDLTLISFLVSLIECGVFFIFIKAKT